ncbi:MAG: hypothetical protein HOV80_23530 [Polyangiaceae bacterium]|nr:hypothetical protein [Polyangiaceae bacterium]
MIYRALTWLLTLIARAFFRQVEVVGLENVPTDGPVIFAGNHPNSLLDPVLIINTCGRRVSFAAKNTLFKSRLLKLVLDGLGAVPLARRDDNPGAAKLDNDAAFTAMYTRLGEGGAIGIFPEGLSHDASQLAALKTGAARLALGARARIGEPVKIIPCGLTFIHPARFRSRVLVQYGPAIEVSEAWAEKQTADEKAAVKELTGAIERGMRALTVNAPDWETVRALDAVRRLYQPLDIEIEDRVELARRFNAHYGDVKEDPRVVEVMGRVRDYQEDLDVLGVTDREIARGLDGNAVARKLAAYLSLFLFWVPLAIPGLPIHAPAILFAKFAGRHLTPRKDVIATTKVLTGFLVVYTSYVVVAAILAWRFGWLSALLAFVILPISGYASLQVYDRFKLVKRGSGALVRRLRFQHELEHLRERRDGLTGDIIRTVNALKPKDLVLLFPRDDDAKSDATPAEAIPG